MSYLQGSMVALVTPFTSQNRLDIHALKNLLQEHKEAKTDAIVCLGTTGETPTLSYEEKLAVLNLCISESEDKIPVIAGTGTNNTQASIVFTKIAKDMGASAALVIVPYYNRPDEKGCFLHFEKIAEVGLPVIFYYHPKRTGVRLPPSFVARLYSEKIIQAVKDGSGDLVWQKALQGLCNIPILSGDDASTFATLQMGGKGSISVIANLFPEKWKKIHDLCFLKKWEEAKSLFDSLLPVIHCLQEEVNPQGIKYALSAQKKCSASLRLPLVESDSTFKEKMNKAIALLEPSYIAG